jgi:hypothetical protein
VSLYEPLFAALAGVRYVVVGGLAVVLHGHARLTADVDIVVDLSPDEAAKAIRALESLGLRPRSPVRAAEFADAAIRRSWIEQEGMRVFSMWDPSNPLREVDLFADHPLPFEELYASGAESNMTARRGDDPNEPPSEDWGSWQQKRERKLVLGADATAEQRLAWLEEALKLALLAGALPKKSSREPPEHDT